MKRAVTAMLVLLLLGMVAAAGCLGGGGETPTKPETPAEGTSPSSTPSSPSSSEDTSSPSATETQTESPSTTETESPTETQPPSEEDYWENPWEYAPLTIGDETYWITYYKYRYKIQPDQNSPTYEYIVEKSIERSTVSVCGMDLMGNKKDLGEHEVYAYKTVVTPINAAGLENKLTITVWYLSNVSNAFIYPWDVLWLSYASPTGAGDNVFVGMEFEYKGKSFWIMNPAPFQNGLFPCFEGDTELPDAVNEDLGYLYMGWVALIHLGFWHEWSSMNVLVPQSGVWSDGMGHTWKWSTSPDGIVRYSGFTFKLVNFEWSYEGTVEGVKLQGEGKFSPDLPLLVESEGYYSYKDQVTGRTTVIYSYLKLEDLKLEENLP
ncbi:hypothetical protein [Thermococcus sp. ES12]|uniref:hypothetical protein n=1 Tax=Thermococcus sp. ES12 TaxID=1638246 RepID=UPI00142F968C|nr:hypothetical protein [Thermococcus sp. ES12]NJE77195.1 hypothetical protein [Thermococcus sp. ES12]